MSHENRQDQDIRAAKTPQSACANTPRNTARSEARAWKRPEFTEISACAEICAYVFRS